MEITLLNASQVILIPVTRSVFGWGVKALKDNKITNFELKKLLETVITTGLYGTFILLGAQGFGVDLSALAAGATAVLMERVIGALKENKNVTKR